jgi:essential nuclear protein 1
LKFQEITEEDEKALQMFMSKEEPKRQTLADIIMEKLREEEDRHGTLEEHIAKKLDPKVVEVYKGVGQLLHTYTVGKLPRAFKVIPVLHDWEEILFLTQPDNWSPAAIRQATRLFASNLNSKLAQRFYNIVLLPRARSEIATNKRLPFHIYHALRKALFKPAAFYKGLILPLLESRRCTLKEATILASILARTSVPVLHSGAALMKIAQMDYSGVNSLFVRVLLNKKYALPYAVIDAVFRHFYSFITDSRKLPLMWFQSLLVFVQRYKNDMTNSQREKIKNLIQTTHSHYYYTDEIQREFSHCVSSRDGPSKMEN